MGLRVTDGLSGQVVGQVQVPMDQLRSTPRQDGMFWLNMKKSSSNVFSGSLGTDDPMEGFPRLLLKYSILDDEESDAAPESDQEDVKQQLNDELRDNLNRSPGGSKIQVQPSKRPTVHKTLEELQDLRDLAHEENMKVEEEFK